MKINPAMSAVTLANIIECPRFEKFYGELYTGETHLAVRKYHEDPRLFARIIMQYESSEHGWYMKNGTLMKIHAMDGLW